MESKDFLDYLVPYDADMDIGDEMRSLHDAGEDEETVRVHVPCPDCDDGEMWADITIVQKVERRCTALFAVYCADCEFLINLYGYAADAEYGTAYGIAAEPVLLGDLLTG
jgi:hypothetical protein